MTIPTTKRRRMRNLKPPEPLCKACGKTPYGGATDRLCTSCRAITNVRDSIAQGGK